MNWADLRTDDPAEQAALYDESEQALRAALALAPEMAPVAHTLGLLCYNHPRHSADPEAYQAQAIDWFTQAVAWDPTCVIAQLYLAHCFHDRRDWPRAIAEYEKVDLDRLARDWPAWRAVKCREQLAHCHAYAGNSAEALQRFTVFLDEIEGWDEDQIKERVVNVDELVDALTHRLDASELVPRVRKLSRHFRWFEKRYAQLFAG
jgi:lipopolysaccharide biosynthesis regulator YciM